jgi:hypothetical protein
MSANAPSDGLRRLQANRGLLRMALLLTLALASIWLGVALVLASFNVWAMSAPGGQKDFGEFVVGGLLLALAAGFGTALVRALRIRTRRPL